MDLETYLNAIENCPDEWTIYEDGGVKRSNSLLTLEHGIYDGYSMVLKTSLDNFEKFLGESNYTCDGRATEDKRRKSIWRHNPGTVVAVAYELGEDVMEEYKDFTIDITLHPYQGGRHEKGFQRKDIGQSKAIALVVSEMGRWALKEKIPIHIISSVGWKYFKTSEAKSRLVEFRPDKIL